MGRPNMRMAKKRKAESHTARPVRNVEKQFRSCIGEAETKIG